MDYSDVAGNTAFYCFKPSRFGVLPVVLHLIWCGRGCWRVFPKRFR